MTVHSTGTSIDLRSVPYVRPRVAHQLPHHRTDPGRDGGGHRRRARGGNGARRGRRCGRPQSRLPGSCRSPRDAYGGQTLSAGNYVDPRIYLGFRQPVVQGRSTTGVTQGDTYTTEFEVELEAARRLLFKRARRRDAVSLPAPPHGWGSRRAGPGAAACRIRSIPGARARRFRRSGARPAPGLGRRGARPVVPFRGQARADRRRPDRAHGDHGARHARRGAGTRGVGPVHPRPGAPSVQPARPPGGRGAPAPLLPPPGFPSRRAWITTRAHRSAPALGEGEDDRERGTSARAALAGPGR